MSDNYIWVKVFMDNNGLFTGEKMINNDVLEVLGGHYPKMNYVIHDSRMKWGKLPIHGRSYVSGAASESSSKSLNVSKK